MDNNVVYLGAKPARGKTIEGDPVKVLGRHAPNTELLRNALSAIREKKSAARSVFMFWPNLRAACVKLAGYYTGFLPSSQAGVSLLEASLKAGFIRYGKATEHGKDPLCAMQCFIAGSLSLAASATKRSLYGLNAKGEWILWQPFSQSVSSWIAGNQISHVMSTEEPSVASCSSGLAKTMLAPNIYSIHDLNISCEHRKHCQHSQDCSA